MQANDVVKAGFRGHRTVEPGAALEMDLGLHRQGAKTRIV